MSLFEKLNNKRYNLQEKPSDMSQDPSPLSAADAKKFDEYDNLSKKEKKNLNKTKNIVSKQTNQKLSSSTRFPDATSGTKSKGRKPVTVNVRDSESPVKKSVDAKVITKKYNEKNPNRPEYVKPKEYKAAYTKTQLASDGAQKRPLGQLVKKTKPSTTAKSGILTPGQIDFSKSGELAAKRKARIDTKTGRATQSGVEDFAKKKYGKGDPTNPKAIKKAKELVKNPASKEYKKIADTINKSDYAGKISKPRSSKLPSLAKVKAKIDAKNPTYISPESGGRLPVKTKTTLVRSKEISKQLNVPKGFKRVPITKKMGEKYPLIKQRVEPIKPPEVLTTPPKPKSKNLFSKVKNLMRTIGQKTKDFRTRPGDIEGNPKWDQFKTKSGNFSRRSFTGIKNIPGSGTLKKQFFKRIVGASPMTKSILALGAATAIVAPSVKKALAPKAKPKEYDVYNKPLGFDTGKKNADKVAYKKFKDGTSAFQSPVKKTYKKT